MTPEPGLTSPASGPESVSVTNIVTSIRAILHILGNIGRFIAIFPDIHNTENQLETHTPLFRWGHGFKPFVCRKWTRPTQGFLASAAPAMVISSRMVVLDLRMLQALLTIVQLERKQNS